jgi:hypothetical protein
MLTFLPSMFAALVGIVFTAILLAAEWYIWDFRYGLFPQRAPEIANSIHVQSASGREVVVIPAPQPPYRNIVPLFQVERRSMDLGA